MYSSVLILDYTHNKSCKSGLSTLKKANLWTLKTFSSGIQFFTIVASMALLPIVTTGIPNALAHASTTSLLCIDDNGNNVLDIAPVLIGTHVTCTADTTNSKVTQIEMKTTDPTNNLRKDEVFSAHTGTIDFTVDKDGLWFVEADFFGKGGAKVGHEIANLIVSFLAELPPPPPPKIHIGDDRCSKVDIVTSETISKAPSNINYHSKCVIIDDEPPKIVKAFVTPDDYQCVQVDDNVQTQSVTFNGTEVPAWLGSQGYFCAKGKLLGITEIIARDSAGNTNEMLSINLNINRTAIKTVTKETFTAFVSKELNPHKDIEGMVLTSTEPIKEIRIAGSPEVDFHSFQVSDQAIQELNGQYTVVVKYYGQHIDRKGELYVFGANRGLIATFDVKVDGYDMKLSQHQEGVTHSTYELTLKNQKLVEDVGSNSLQKVKLQDSIHDGCKQTLTQLIFRAHYVPRATTTIC